MAERQNRDPDAGKGAVEDRDHSNTSLAGQNPHRTDDPMVKANDTDFPEPGNNPEHSGEPRDSEFSPQREQVNQDPGQRQKQMHNDEKDDPLAA
jgi:hypothetical protein